MKASLLKYYIIMALASMCMSCAGSDEPDSPKEETAGSHTYQMQFEGGFGGFEGSRADGDAGWADGDVVYLQFNRGDVEVSGKAVYKAITGQWTLSTDEAMEADTDGDCRGAFFGEGASQAGSAVSLTPQTAVFADSEGTFIINADKMVFVKLYLTPVFGRVKFKGAPSMSFSLSGLTCAKTYDMKTGSIATVPRTVSGSMNVNGETDYFYAAFSDAQTRKLVMDGSGKTSWTRTFGQGTLAAGESGYITLPYSGNPGAWKLINNENMEEITMPAVSETEVSRIRSTYASLSAKVTDAGNGRISRVGFIYSTSPTPSTDNGKISVCGTSHQIVARLAGLAPSTMYYARAFATNEFGTAYGEIISFKTLSTEEDKTTIGKDDFDKDENLNGIPSSSGNVSKDQFSNDDNLNGTPSSSGNVQREEFENDKNWN